MELADECLKHLTLILENWDVCIPSLLDFLLQVKRQGLWVQFSQQSEWLELFFFRGSILIDFVLHNAWNEGNFLCIVRRSCHFSGESQCDQRWTGSVDIINCANTVFGARDWDFLLAPCASVLLSSSLNWVLDCEPAWSLDLLLQDEKLEHRLLRSKDGVKSVTAQIGR